MLRAVPDGGVMICSLPPSHTLSLRSTLPVHSAGLFLLPLLHYLFTYLLSLIQFPPLSPLPVTYHQCSLMPFTHFYFFQLPPLPTPHLSHISASSPFCPLHKADAPLPHQRLIKPTSSSPTLRLYANTLDKSSTWSPFFFLGVHRA